MTDSTRSVSAPHEGSRDGIARRTIVTTAAWAAPAVAVAVAAPFAAASTVPAEPSSLTVVIPEIGQEFVVGDPGILIVEVRQNGVLFDGDLVTAVLLTGSGTALFVDHETGESVATTSSVSADGGQVIFSVEATAPGTVIVRLDASGVSIQVPLVFVAA